ncbi:hypothetical protein [Mangrovimonas cancribranchiae]|uniref:Core-binding (CB) domain-containing protein n=1 Tax=Mangrovimonas cancribranchiae TaxID=3080055 RepID=A0AAU6P4Q3_9FLAO
MSSVLSFILQVHDSVHDFTMKPNYNEPKIYTGGVDVTRWSKLTSKEKKAALKKDWYVYYSFRNPKTGYLEQQKRIKASANRFSTKRHRLKILKPIQRQLLNVLDAGYNPYKEDNSHVKRRLMGEPETIKVEQAPKEPLKNHVNHDKSLTNIPDENIISLEEAKDLVLKTKKKVLNENSYPKYKSRINQFYRWLYDKGFKKHDSVMVLDKKVVIQYLNDVLQKTSARNRNNTRIDLSSFIETLIDNDVLQANFVKKINKLKSVS